MFFSGISEFESKFKAFDRLNALVFNVWRDKNALAYRDGDIARITNEYRRYISKVRSLSEETNKLERELEGKLREIENLARQVADINYNPEIKDCSIYEAWGENTVRAEDGSPRTIRSRRIRFVAKWPPEPKARELIGDSYTDVLVSGSRTPL